MAEIGQAAPHLELTRDDVALVMAGFLPIGSGELVGEDVSFGKRPLVVDHARADGVDGLVSAVANRYTVARGVARTRGGPGASASSVARRRPAAPRPPRSTAGTLPSSPRWCARWPPPCRSMPRWPSGSRTTTAPGTGEVVSLVREAPAWGAPFPGTDVLPAEVVYAVRHEMARRLADVVFRRTGLGTAGHPGDAALESCAALAASELGWNRAKTAAELDEVRARFRGFGAAPRD